MSPEIWFAFVAASTVLLLMPGPTTITVAGYSMAYGRRSNMPLVVAVALGTATALCASLLGLGTLLATSAFWFTVVKWLGGMYLLFLGIRMLRASTSPADILAPDVVGSRWKLFANTYAVTALNPKGIIFLVAFLPQFVNPNANVSQQLWILATTFIIMAVLSVSLYALFAGSARQILASRRAQRCFNIGSGSLLCAAGVWALLAKRVA